ncbi:MAG: hypothetical protein ACTHJI_17660 [Leifsonia sp.]
MSDEDNLNTPPGWDIDVNTGWSLFGSTQDRVPQVRLNRQVSVPQSFEMTIKDDTGDLSLALLFLVIDKEPRIHGALNLTTAIDLESALSRLWGEHGQRWWIKKAIATLAVRALAIDAFARHGTESDRLPPIEEQRILDAIESIRQMPSTRRKDKVTDAVLQEVAEVYRSAVDDGANPTQAVAEHFYKSHSTAARWVMRARQSGHLGLANGRRGGELTSADTAE